jgi:phage shock protein E
MLIQFFKRFFLRDNSELQKAVLSNPVLLDVRSSEEFASGSVKSAINIPVQNLNSNISRIPKGRVIVAFCRSGSRSAMAVQILRKNGFQDVVNGGSWQNVQAVITEMKKSI